MRPPAASRRRLACAALLCAALLLLPSAAEGGGSKDKKSSKKGSKKGKKAHSLRGCPRLRERLQTHEPATRITALVSAPRRTLAASCWDSPPARTLTTHG